MTTPPAKPHESWHHRPVVYRMYDSEDRLLYVGASHLLPHRISLHEQRSWWHRFVARVAWEWHPTREAAFAAEAVAIQEEQPRYNIKGTGRPRGDFSHLTADELQAGRDWWNSGAERCMFPMVFRDYLRAVA